MSRSARPGTTGARSSASRASTATPRRCRSSLSRSGCRRSCATSATCRACGIPRQHGPRRGRGGDLRGARLQGRRRRAREGAAAPALRDGRRLLRPARISWSPPRKYIDLYSDPGYTGQEIGVTNYGFASNFTPELFRRLHAIYAGEVTMTDLLARAFRRSASTSSGSTRTRWSCCSRTTDTCSASADTPARCPRSSTPSSPRCR